AAERALSVYDTALGTRGALQSVALEDIVVLLSHLRDVLADWSAGAGQDDPPRIPQTLGTLRDRFTELAENAVAFMGSIQRPIDLHDPDADAFRVYRERPTEYIG